MADGAEGMASFMSKETAGLPNWAWGAIIVVGIGATFVVPKLFGRATGNVANGNTGVTSTDSGTANAGLGLAVDPTSGLPYAVEGLVPSGGLSGTSQGTSTTTQNQLMNEIGKIRARNTSGPTAAYDKKYAQGVPIHSGTSSASPITGYEPYGTQVMLEGNSVPGASNLGNSQWYPVLLSGGQTGYVSGYDFNGAPQPQPITWPYA